MTDIVRAYLGGSRFLTVLLEDKEQFSICPFCGGEIFIGRTKFKTKVAIEFDSNFKYRPHQITCKEFSMKEYNCHVAVSSVKFNTKLNKSDTNDRYKCAGHITGKTIC